LPLLDLVGVTKSFGRQRVLDGVSFPVDRGEVVSVIGPSGSGKSTLLLVLIGLERLASGRIILDGTPIDYDDRARLRAVRDRMAIVFQSYNLFQNMTVLRNITIAPLRVKRRDPRVVRAEAVALLERVGLADKLAAYPDELSGGQQQRVAIARALVNDPSIVFADEPTGNLDSETSRDVMALLQRLNQERGHTFVLVTHDPNVARVANRVVAMRSGRIEKEYRPTEF